MSCVLEIKRMWWKVNYRHCNIKKDIWKKNKFLHSLISVDILWAEKKKKKLVQICVMLILNLLRLDLRR